MIYKDARYHNSSQYLRCIEPINHSVLAGGGRRAVTLCNAAAAAMCRHLYAPPTSTNINRSNHFLCLIVCSIAVSMIYRITSNIADIAKMLTQFTVLNDEVLHSHWKRKRHPMKTDKFGPNVCLVEKRYIIIEKRYSKYLESNHLKSFIYC